MGENALPDWVRELEHVYAIAPIGLCYFDVDLRYVYINEWLARINGRPVQAHLGQEIGNVLKEVAAGVVPQLAYVLETGEPVIEGEVEAETPAHPGEKRCYMHNFHPDKSNDGMVVGVSCVVQDITERKQAEEALRDMHEQLEARVQDRTPWLQVANAASIDKDNEHRKKVERLHYFTGKLILAQEDERRRIGRELHDGLTQNLAAMAIDVGRLSQQVEASEDTDEEGLHKIREGLIESCEYVQALSRQLHPALVEDLGIAAALRSLCEELEQNDGVPTDYKVSAIPADIPNGHELCVYRVAQEALRNIVKHSRATRAQVHLHLKKETLQFQVRDNGIGFNLNEAENQIGLGLQCMGQRVWQLGGTMRVETGPGEGTVISVSIPLT